MGAFLNAVKNWQCYSDENSDDRDDDKQFNESKRSTKILEHRNLHRTKNVGVIPSEVEGSPDENCMATRRDSSTPLRSARNDRESLFEVRLTTH